jgi:pre-mRNA-processing factor 6
MSGRGQAPMNYVAGLGRGATGFTTRADLGPARPDAATPGMAMGPPSVSFGAAPAGYVAGRGRGALGMGLHQDKQGEEGDDNDRGDYSDAQFDEFSGYMGGSLFADSEYDAEDREADSTWAAIDEKMDQRRKARREKYEREQAEKLRRERPKIQAQFADLKRDLSQVSEEEWANIPDIGDRSVKRQKKVSLTPVPDKIILEAAQRNAVANTVQLQSGFETPGATPIRDLAQIGNARKKVLDLKLTKMSDSVGGQTHVDPRGYLTELSGLKLNTDAEIGDFKKARLLLKSVISTNPKHPPGWIAYARLEELAGKIGKARKLIAKACQMCSASEDVWLEAARLNTPANAKVILARAVKEVPGSVRIWIHAANLEDELVNKKRVLRKALEEIPDSVKLWKASVELEEPQNARVLLSRAVECVPHSVEMWIALAHLESYANARKVLNKAREAVPTDHSIWIEACKLEEANKNENAVPVIMQRALKSLAGNMVHLDREAWLAEAEKTEAAGHPITCQAIVSLTIGIGLAGEGETEGTAGAGESRIDIWLDDVDGCLKRASVNCARAILAHALRVFPKREMLWMRAAMLEKQHGTRQSLDDLLRQAVLACPQAELLWLMGAKEKWLAGDVPAARNILQLAFEANFDSEAIWLAAAKLERENAQPQRARAILEKARASCSTERVWLKSVRLERCYGDVSAMKRLLRDALAQFPQSPLMWQMLGEAEEHDGRNYPAASEAMRRGLKNCPLSVELWLAAAELEQRAGNAAKARSILEHARGQSAKNDRLWMAQIRLEVAANNRKVAQQMLAKAMQECPGSGLLWSAAVSMENGAHKKARSVDALKNCDNDPHVLLQVALLFWNDHKFDKARTWLEKALTGDVHYGDAWAYLYRFAQATEGMPGLAQGVAITREEVVRRCVEAHPKNGFHWRLFAKSFEHAASSIEQLLPLVAPSLALV